MKPYLFIVLLLGASTCATAQNSALKDTTNDRLFIGINATTIGYNLEYKHEPKGGDIRTYSSINIGIKLNKRARVQIGASYGTDNTDHSDIYVESPSKLVYLNDISRTWGVAMPIMFDYILLHPLKRLQLYGTIMITPIYSTTRHEKSEERDGIATNTFSAKTSGINTYLTAGFGLSYPIGNRFDAYANYYMISRNFNRGLRSKDGYPCPGSITLGLNYNLNLKR